MLEVVKLPNEDKGAVATNVGELIKILQQVPEDYQVSLCGCYAYGVCKDDDEKCIIIDDPVYLEDLLEEEEKQEDYDGSDVEPLISTITV